MTAATPIMTGAWTPPGPNPWTGSTAARYQATFGTPAGGIHFYQDLVHKPAFPTAQMQEIVDHGAIPILSWELDDYTGGIDQPIYSNAAFARGDHDAQLIVWLQAAAAWGRPFIIRFFWEMNGGDYPWGYNHNGNSPGSFIDAWRHVAQLIYTYCPQAQNLWCPSIDWPVWHQIPFELLWPEDRFVDIVGLDGYNQHSNPGGVWLSFEQIIRPCLDRIIALPHAPKRIIIAETGCRADGGDRPAWIADMLASLLTMPQVRGVLWWNNQITGGLDCRLEVDPATLATWKAVIAAPYLRGVWT